MSNLSALLATISHGEGTDQYPDPYAVVFGGGSFANFMDHPAITGEWMGTDYNGRWTTAAGKYQITRSTWVALRRKITLPDFTPQSQDKAAIELIGEVGGLAALSRGDLAATLNLIRNIWASLPGNDAGQPQKTAWQLAKFYTDAGGMLA